MAQVTTLLTRADTHPFVKILLGHVTRSYLKKNLRAPGVVTKRLKMLTYYVYAPLSRHFVPYQEP